MDKTAREYVWESCECGFWELSTDRGGDAVTRLPGSNDSEGLRNHKNGLGGHWEASTGKECIPDPLVDARTYMWLALPSVYGRALLMLEKHQDKDDDPYYNAEVRGLRAVCMSLSELKQIGLREEKLIELGNK